LRATEDGNAIPGFVMPRHMEIRSIGQIISIILSNQIQLSDSEWAEGRKGAKLAASYWILSAFCWKIDCDIFLPRSSFASRGKGMRRSRTLTPLVRNEYWERFALPRYWTEALLDRAKLNFSKGFIRIWFLRTTFSGNPDETPAGDR
jgi:hypothetical protein